MSPYTGLAAYSGPAEADRPLEELIAVARKQRPATLVIKNARAFNAFTGEFSPGDVAVEGGYIAGIGQYDGAREYDAAGRYLVPGFIDGHVHLESAMACPAEYAKVAAAHGTSAAVIDPHEVANVAGTDGLAYILEATENLPISVYVMLPSCVPASPLEWGGARLVAADLAPFLGHPRVLGLGEVMNFPGVLGGAPEVMAKLRLVQGQGAGGGTHLRIDGHSPGLSGPDLQGYIAAGISSDHECSTLAEARERLALGMAVMLREGTATHNLLELLPAVTEHTAPLCMLATDDIHLGDLIREGHINYLVRLAVKDGRVPLPTILKMASLNPSRHYDLRGLGAIAPGYGANFALYSDLENWRPDAVWHKGELVAEAGKCLWTRPLGTVLGDTPGVASAGRERIYNSVRLPNLGAGDLKIQAASPQARVIGIVPGQIVTEHLILDLPVVNGAWEADPSADIAKLAVVERHRDSGHVGLGLVRGLKLRRGAIASTVAHDSHNLVVAGVSDADMLTAIAALGEMRGGLVAVEGGRVLAKLPLPLAGLLSEAAAPDIEAAMDQLHAAAQTLREGDGGDVFMLLSFLSLPVIPKLKLTEAGLVDVEAFKVVNVAV